MEALFGRFLEEAGNIMMMLPTEVLLSLPDHLRKSLIILSCFGQATALMIAKQSKRARPVESAYLNQLCIMGYARKERRRREVWFIIKIQNDVIDLIKRIDKLTAGFRDILGQDLKTALLNRLEVLEKKEKNMEVNEN